MIGKALILTIVSVFIAIISHCQDSATIAKKIVHYPVKYPQKAKEEGISGTVIIGFNVDSTCSLVDRKVKEGIGYGCDEAALSVLDKVEKDVKKDNNSKCKPSSITMPIKFILK